MAYFNYGTNCNIAKTLLHYNDLKLLGLVSNYFKWAYIINAEGILVIFELPVNDRYSGVGICYLGFAIVKGLSITSKYYHSYLWRISISFWFNHRRVINLLLHFFFDKKGTIQWVYLVVNLFSELYIRKGREE